MGKAEAMRSFQFGRINPLGGSCCGKPLGCTMTGGCLLLRHPAKRAAAGDRTVRCPKASQQPHPDTGEWVAHQCVLANLHGGDCEPRP